jgi:MFS family permease
VAAGIPFLFLSTNPVVLSLAAAVFGIGLGGDFMIIPLMTAEIFGIKILGRLMGVILTAGGVAEALSPMLIGHLRDTSGTYKSGCVVLVALALLGAAAVVALPKSRRTA